MRRKDVVTVILIILGLGGAFLSVFGFAQDRMVMAVGGGALFLVSLTGAKVVQRRWRQQREQGLRRVALEMGFQFSEQAPSDSPEWFGPLSLGPGITTNVLWGEWRGNRVTAFDETWSEQPFGTYELEDRVEETRSAAVTPAPQAFPATVIRSKSSGAKLVSDRSGEVRQVLLGGALDESFEVSTEDATFARKLVDEEMEAWLLSAGQGLTFEVVGSWALCSAKEGLEPLDPEWIRRLIEAVVDFRDRLPAETLPDGGS
jgi:hypothetical protein